MTQTPGEVARLLARHAEAVCRHYLPAGRREGRYWLVGDVLGSAGRSLFVRLSGGEQGKGAAGKWTDAATTEHGDLLDLIGRNLSHRQLSDTLDEARRFLSLPKPAEQCRDDEPKAPAGSRKAGRRLFAASQPIAGTLAEHYLRRRGLAARHERWLRFHPRCWYRASADDRPGTPNAFPALIAAVTDNAGTITGIHRTWLDRATADKASVDSPRRAMSDLLGHGVRLGGGGSVMAAGEGLETMLSLRQIMPAMPMIAALSATHLAQLIWPATLRRLYVVRDADPAGDAAWAALSARAASERIELRALYPATGNDFNELLMVRGRQQLAEQLAGQLAQGDAEQFIIEHR